MRLLSGSRTLLRLLLPSTCSVALVFAQDGRSAWSPLQATGEPDTAAAGDHPTAWASATPDDAREWLVVEYEHAVVPLAVKVHETFHPGALVRVSALHGEREEVLWEGVDPLPRTIDRGFSVIPLLADQPTSRMKLELDSPAVPGWNEIDAVALLGRDGSWQWARSAEASSAYPATRTDRPEGAEASSTDAPIDARTVADGLLAVLEAWLARHPDAPREELQPLCDEILAVQARPPAEARAEQGFEGLWQTSYGPMRLQRTGEQLAGTYGFGGGSAIEGRVADRRFTFRYREPDAAGEGSFVLAADGASFDGRWRPDGREQWSPWKGSRPPPPIAGRTWLVILEAPWGEAISQPDYSFGGMLRAIFAGSESVEVRQRSFRDLADFQAWCAELVYVEEPIHLVIATHGSKAGIQGAGGSIGADEIAAALAPIEALRLVHFSACETMAGAIPDAILAAKRDDTRFSGVSGYDVSVDWMASALTEFLYFDLLLNRGVEPERAANEVLSQLGFARSKAPEESLVPAAHFRFQGREPAER